MLINRRRPSAMVVLSAFVGVGLYYQLPRLGSKGTRDYSPGSIFRECDTCPEMVVIPGASRFVMGQDDTIPSDSFRQLLNETDTSRGPAHLVTIGRFAIGRTEVTQGQWQALMGSNPSSEKSCGTECPVEHVNLDDIRKFIEKLNSMTDHQYRLASEAEWEYVARGGTDDHATPQDDAALDDYAWHEGNSAVAIHPVAQKKPNAFNVHDMQGNVWEWVDDCFHASYEGAPVDGSAWTDVEPAGRHCRDRYRVVRGGSCISPQRSSRDRGKALETRREPDIGFRLAMSFR